MIILLRTLGIPARWVKGYTEGEYVNTPEPEVRLYEIRNANAHSWVEVYFPGTGWVPFEPTRGFRNPYNFTNDFNKENIDLRTSLASQQEIEEIKEMKEIEQQDNKTPSDKNGNYKSFKKKIIILVSSLIIIFFLFMIFKRANIKWLIWFLLLKYKYRKGEGVYEDANLDLLKILEVYGVPTGTGQTLREYAHYIDKKLGSTEMKQLTYRYEIIIYAREDSKEYWEQSVELWENLIKRLSS